MGTRSRVGIMQGDVCKSVYCHYDGYLEHTGKTLLKHYDSGKVLELLKLGDNSGIQETLEEMNFYRNRGETGIDARDAHTFEEFLDQVENCGAEYYYVMRDDVWYAGCVYDTEGLIKGGLVPLADAIADVLIAQAVAEDE